ncbi:unnamed protein product [Ectocarpus sp. 6 AP-2014]
MHSLFDFGLDGDLHLPEVTILVRTALIACAKLDSRVTTPSTEAIEGLCRTAFNQAGLDDEGALAKHLFESFVSSDSQMTAFLQLWSDSISQAAVTEGNLWEDPDFPADPSALSLVAGTVPPGIPPGEAVRWLRPSEVAGGEAVLFVGDVPGDGPMVPGQLADQWLLSAIGILTGRPQLLRSLFVPTGQEALGRYCVRLFKEANWINVFVDTRIACNALGDPLFCRGEERHELWGFLLEKAYAKAHGCYENLMHGDTREALRDLTGGVSEKLQWQLGGRPGAAGASAATPGQAAPGEQQEIPRPRVAGWGILAGTTPPLGWVFENIRDRLSDGQVLGCSRQAWVRCPWGVGDQQEAADGGMLFPPSNRVMKGLCSGVSYCVLEAFEKGGTRLLRLRDPWAARQRGAEPGEYLGDWGPSSRQWSARALASELLPRTLRGMFWMEMGDFLRVFTEGKGWLQGTQVFLEIGPRDSSSHNSSGGTTTSSGLGNTTATGAVAPSSGTPKSAHNKDDTAQVLITDETKNLTRPFVPRRDVSCRLALPQGQYVIVATSLEAGVAGRFWVHVKADRDFVLQSSFPGAANAGSNAGSCGIKAREVGMSVEIAHNEVEENAEGNGLTADAESLGGLLKTAQELVARKAAAEHQHQIMLQEQAERKENQDTVRDADTIVAEDGVTCTATDANIDDDEKSLVVGRHDGD